MTPSVAGSGATYIACAPVGASLNDRSTIGDDTSAVDLPLATSIATSDALRSSVKN